MLTRADDLDTGSTLTADVCVIGGGAAGITLAMELHDTGIRVLLLESGTTDYEAATQALYEGANVGQPAAILDGTIELDQFRLRYLGGTTNHWAGFCRPLAPIDFERRDHLAVSGWPLAHAELVPYWERAAEWCRIGDGDFDPAGWAERTGMPLPSLESGSVAPFVFKTTFPMPFGEVYRTALDSSASVEVVLGANVVNIATDDGRTITGLDVRSLAGTALRVEADAYVLATGGIENARLLLASTDADPAGLGNDHDLVGRHFTEHLQVFAGFGVLEPSIDELRGLVGTEVAITEGRHAGDDHGVKYAIGLTDDHVRDERTTGIEVQVSLGTLPMGVPRQDEGAGANDIADLLGRVATTPRTVAYFQSLAEQRLDPRSRVTLGTDTDALGMRRVRLDWQYGPDDRRAALDGLQVIAEALGASGLGRMQLVPGGVHADAHDNLVPGEFLTLYRSVPGEIDPLGFPVGMGFHHMCTTRMADDPAEGVVDADCRVHGIDNLWVAGSSVFATGGVATPTYTIVALAVRLADHLRERLAT